MRSLVPFSFVLVVVVSACGASTGVAPPDVSRPAADDASRPGTELDAAADDIDAGVSNACITLTLTFVGCDAERRAECEREYASVSSAHRELIDRDAACFPAIDPASWPTSPSACTPTAIPPRLHVWTHWFHGGCQGLNGQVMSEVLADPGFPSCTRATSGTGTLCFFGGTLGG